MEGKNDDSFTRAGIVTETGKDYIVITQGNTLSGHVLPITYKETEEEMSEGRIVHVIYPDRAFNYKAAEDVTEFLRAQGFCNSAILGILVNMDADSGLIPYRCEDDRNFDNAYSASYQYTAEVDSGKISRAIFAGNLNDPELAHGYGLAMIRGERNKESLYDLSKKRGTSIGDPETQMITLMDIWKTEMVSIERADSLADEITLSYLKRNGYVEGEQISLYDLLMNVADNTEGIKESCNAMLVYYEGAQSSETDLLLEKAGEYINVVKKTENDNDER